MPRVSVSGLNLGHKMNNLTCVDYILKKKPWPALKSFEPLSEVNQLRQRSNGCDMNKFTPICSTPAAHGGQNTKPRSDAFSKDSGIKNSHLFSFQGKELM